MERARGCESIVDGREGTRRYVFWHTSEERGGTGRQRKGIIRATPGLAFWHVLEEGVKMFGETKRLLFLQDLRNEPLVNVGKMLERDFLFGKAHYERCRDSFWAGVEE